MSSESLDSLIHSFPESREVIANVESLAETQRGAKLPLVLPLERFFKRFSLPETSRSAELVYGLEKAGLLTKIYRVESQSGGGIADYRTMLDIPREIYDPRIDEKVSVTLDKIKILYTFSSADR